jgi:DNA ligase (NAD+)
MVQSLPAGWEAWGADQLEAEVRAHNGRYWDDDAATVSDYDYDRLVEALRAANPNAAVLQAMGPTDATRAGNAVTHAAPMLSLDKAYDEEALMKWAAKFEGQLVMTPKIDGVACSIRYDASGALIVAATRGNGVQGEDITSNVLRISNVPQQIEAGEALEVRGEVYLPLARFRELTGFANPRNTAAGALKQKNPDKSAAIGLKFFLYDVIGPEIDSELHKFEWARDHGFSPVEHEMVSREDVQKGYETYVTRRAALDFEIDGVVFKANKLVEQLRLGATSHHPRYAIAYKLQGDSAPTYLREVEWSVSRTGVLTPVGIVDPVSLSGATVTRISLANWGLVQTKNLTLNAEVIAMRRGGVIPYLEAVSTPGDTAINPPEGCPACGTPPVVEGDFIYCRGTECSAQSVGILEHFAKAIDIEGFGRVWLETLVDAGVLNTPVDFYTLKPEHLLRFERMGATLANKLVANIEAKRAVPLATFLRSLGIHGLGKTASKTLAGHFLTLPKVRAAEAPELVELPKFGEILAEGISQGLLAKTELIEGLLAQVTVVDAEPTAPATEGPWTGTSFLFTGTLVAMKRTEAQKKVVEYGGSKASGVSKSLGYLVVGNAGKAGSKLTKAEKAGVSVLTEDAFLEMLAEIEGGGDTEA